jgi:DNA-binding NtrC family response regulator
MEPPRSGAAPPQRHVLVVDDDESCCRALELFFENSGQPTHAFRTFEAARGWLKTASPDIAVVDVRLGSYNGLQLIHLIHELNPEAVLVAMSGFDDSVLRKEADGMGASFLMKPLDLTALKQVVGLAPSRPQES